MEPLCEIENYKLVVNHVLDELKKIPSNSIHSVTTSPPYFGLRSYGTFAQIWGGSSSCNHEWVVTPKTKKWPEHSLCKCGAWRGELGLEPWLQMYIDHMVDIFKEIKRILREDGTVFLNIGDVSNAEIRKPLSPGKLFNAKDALLVPCRVGIALQEDGWIVRQTIIWAKSGGNCPQCGFRVEKGDAKPAPVRTKLVPAHEYIILLAKNPEYYFDYVGVQEKPGVNRRDVLYLTSSKYAGAHYAVMPEKLAEFCVTAGVSPKVCRACGAPWYRQVEGRSETKADRLKRVKGKTKEGLAPRHDGGSLQQGIHIGTFPKTTIGWASSCDCNTDTIPGIVLDPFSGTATTGVSALKLNRRYFGIDVDPTSVELALPRLKKELKTEVING